MQLAVGSNRVGWPELDPEAATTRVVRRCQAGATQGRGWRRPGQGREPRRLRQGCRRGHRLRIGVGDRLWVSFGPARRTAEDSAVLAFPRPIRRYLEPDRRLGAPREVRRFGNGDIDRPASSSFRPSAPGAISRCPAPRPAPTVGLRGCERRGRSRPDGHALVVRRDQRWHPTGLRGATSAPAYAVAAIPDNPALVYVGTRARRAPKRAVSLRGQPAWSTSGTGSTTACRKLPSTTCVPWQWHPEDPARLPWPPRGMFEVDVSTNPSCRPDLLRRAPDPRRASASRRPMLSASLANPDRPRTNDVALAREPGRQDSSRTTRSGRGHPRAARYRRCGGRVDDPRSIRPCWVFQTALPGRSAVPGGR